MPAEMIAAMRDEYRLKLNCDYAYTVKQGQLQVLCHDVYKEIISEYAERFGIRIAAIHTYT